MTRCPSLDQLEALLDEQLEEADQRRVAAHVGACARCQAALEQMTRDPVTASLSGTAGGDANGSAIAPDDSRTAFLERLKQSRPPAGGDRAELYERDGSFHMPPLTAKPASGAEPPVVAGYEVLSELGRGGMGVVYKARHRVLNRLVALKMILAGPHAGPKDLERFRKEAEAVARLRHPNVVQIYDVGESQGCPFFALEYIEDGSLARRLRGDPQPLVPAARLAETLARAIHSAHQQGIIHRDLKPANVLLARSDPIHGVRLNAGPAEAGHYEPKITDFGLAKRLDDPSARTQSGEVVGTPSYMAPEQAGGAADRVGPATDVYALGAILYELLTGRPPFKAATGLDTVLQVLHEEPVRPSSLRPDLPRDLETICLKCLAKEPAKRYAGADKLADDLNRFRHGRPILARPVGVTERAWKWARHRPLPAALLLSTVLIALLGFAGITWQWHEATRARDAALAEKRDKERERQEAEQARADAVEAQRQEADQRQRARSALYFSRIAQSQLNWRVNDFASAGQNLEKCLPAPGQEDRRGWEWYYLHGLLHADLFTLEHRTAGPGGGVAFCARGTRIASVVGGNPADEPGRPGEVRIWNASGGELLHDLPGPGTLHRLAFRPDGDRLALATTDGTVLLWDPNTGKEFLRRTLHTQAVACVAFSPDGKLLASAGWDGVVKVCDGTTGEVLDDLRGHKGHVQSVAWHPDGRRVATAGWDGTIKVWDVPGAKELQTLLGHKGAVYCVAFSPDGKLLASAGNNGNLKVWDLEAGRTVQSLTGHAGAVLSVAFSPDSRYLAYGGGDGTVRLWDVESGVERVTFRGHTAPVEGVHFSPDGRRLVSCSPAQGAVKVWDLTRHPEYATFARTGSDVEALAFEDGGRRLVSVTVGGRLQTWDAETGLLLEERLLAMNDQVVSPAVPASFAPGGRRLAGRSKEDPRVVKLWDVATGEEGIALRGHTLPVVCVRFSRGRLMTAGYAGTNAGGPHEIRLWDGATGKALASVSGRGRILGVAPSPDGRWAAFAGQDGQVILVDWESGQESRRAFGHKGDLGAVAFSPDGRSLASAGVEDRAVEIWRRDTPDGGAADWRLVESLPGPTFLCDLTFSPDGRRLAGISRDLVKVWEVETGHEVLTLRGAPQRHWDPPFNPRLTFSPDGTRLAGTNWDESVSIWDADRQIDAEAWARRQARRRQAAEERRFFWHLQEAENCREHNNLSAMRFHLQWLRDVPLAGPLQPRKDRLAAQLEEKH